MKKNIVFLDSSTFPSNILFPKLSFNHTWKNYKFTKKAEVKERINKANIVVTNKIELNKYQYLGKVTPTLRPTSLHKYTKQISISRQGNTNTQTDIFTQIY